MNQQRALSPRGRTYVVGVILAGLVAVGASFTEMLAHPVGYQWFVLAALTVISGSATVKLPSIPASLSVSETFVFTSVLLFGPLPQAPDSSSRWADHLALADTPTQELHRSFQHGGARAVNLGRKAMCSSTSRAKPLSQHKRAFKTFCSRC